MSSLKIAVQKSGRLFEDSIKLLKDCGISYDNGWKKDLVKINGFNQEMQYGGQDRELGERLENLGIKGKQIRYSAICVHLDHARGYVNPETWAKNNAIRKNTRDQKLTWTEQGITTNL